MALSSEIRSVIGNQKPADFLDSGIQRGDMEVAGVPSVEPNISEVRARVATAMVAELGGDSGAQEYFARPQQESSPVQRFGV